MKICYDQITFFLKMPVTQMFPDVNLNEMKWQKLSKISINPNASRQQEAKRIVCRAKDFQFAFGAGNEETLS